MMQPIIEHRQTKNKKLSTVAIWMMMMMMMSILGCTLSQITGSLADNLGANNAIPTPYSDSTPTSTPESDQSLLNEKFLIDETIFTTNENCSLPCWRGIRVGVTEWSTAIAILEDESDLSDINVELNSESGEGAITFQRVDGVPCCLLYSEDVQVVDQILLQLSPIHTLETIIEFLGEPTYFNGTEVDETQAAAALFYPERNSVIYVFVEGEQGDLMPTSEIFAVLLLSSDDMQQVLNTSTLQAYDGYKSFADYMDDEPVLTPIFTP